MQYSTGGDGTLFTFSFQSFKNFKNNLKKEYKKSTGENFNVKFSDKMVRSKIYEILLHINDSKILSGDNQITKDGEKIIQENINLLSELTLKILSNTKFCVNKIIDYQ